MRNLRIAALAAAALAAIAAAPATTAAASSPVPSAPSTASPSSTHAKPLHPSTDKTTDRKSGGVGQLSLTSNYGTLAYTNLPYIPDLGAGACTTLTDGRMLSGIESTETHEYAETVTDFWPTAGWYNSGGGEIGDECENLDAYETLSTGTFDVQGLWSNKAGACVTAG
jgi:hypothetical protein